MVVEVGKVGNIWLDESILRSQFVLYIHINQKLKYGKFKKSIVRYYYWNVNLYDCVCNDKLFWFKSGMYSTLKFYGL